MKICLVTHTFPKYKADTTAAFMHPFVLGLIKSGIQVVVFTPFNPALKIHEFPYKIVTYKYFWPEKFHVLGYSQTLKGGMNLRYETYILGPFLFLFGLLRLLQLLRKEKFDIISSHWILPNGFISFLASKLTGIPYTVSLPGSDVYLANKNPIFSYLSRITAEGAKAVIADSPIYISELAKTGAPFDKSYIIPYPVNILELKTNNSRKLEIQKRLGIKRDTFIILSVGRLIYKKGFNYLLKALPRIIKKHKNLIAIILGDGDLRTDWEKLAKKLKVENNVLFLGNIERNEIATFYSLADIFVMPSIKDREGNIDDRPVALLEALASGLPAVATNFPGNRLSIKNNVNGFLVSQKNPDAIAAAILKFINKPHLLNAMKKNAKTLAQAQFSLEVVGKKYYQLFKSII